jgi:hypothetical protein
MNTDAVEVLKPRRGRPPMNATKPIKEPKPPKNDYKTPIYMRKAINRYKNALKEIDIDEFNKRNNDAVIKSRLKRKQQQQQQID